MKQAMKQVKDKLYYYFAEKNWGVRREYPIIKAEYDAKGEKIGKWIKLIHLNWHYRVLRKKEMLYCEETPESVKKNCKLPYLDGAESEISNRRPVIFLVKELLEYDVISFDIFDTLILRPFAKPADLFMIVGKRLNKIEFYRIRVDAEKRARELAMNNKGNHEITIDDIYTIIEEKTGIPKDLGIRAEIEVEMQYCFANPYMKRVFQLLKEQKKTIVITSDMYLPCGIMEKILIKSGYTGYERLYISCEYDCNKRLGGLYQYIKRDYFGKKIIHIGDNPISDIQSAKKSNIATIYYKSVHELGARYRSDGMSSLIGSAYSGIVNTHLHNGIQIYSPAYEYGFIYGGLYILGFCNWIHSEIKAKNIDKILFLSRDGAIYQEIFGYMFEDMNFEYFLWSRIANAKYTCTINKEAFIKKVVLNRAVRSEAKISISSLLESLSLNTFKSILPQYGLSEKTLVLNENAQMIEKMFIENWDLVNEEYKTEKERLREYIKRKIGDSNKVAIVDVGWLGSGPLGLKYLIEEEFKLNCEVYCLQAAASPPYENDLSADLLDDTIKTYLFSPEYNRENFTAHKYTNNGVNSIFFELFTQAKHPSYSGITKIGEYIFDIPEVENYKTIEEIHEGIRDFCLKYKETFRMDSYMYNISGHDAYMPYRMLIRDLTFLKNSFGKIAYARGISGDYKNQSMETIFEILDGVGLGKKE